MNKKDAVSIVTGILVNYSQKLNPFKREAHAIVMVKDKTITIPIDIRQKRFVEKEYPVGSKIELYYDGNWHINSKPAFNEPALPFENTIYT